MKAKANTNYAVISNNEVVQIFSGNDVKEWDSNSIHAVEIPKDKEVFIGTKFDLGTNSFIYPTLDEEKALLLKKVNFFFERELDYLKGDVAQGEIDTWNDQLREANSLKARSAEPTPLLNSIASKRGIDINILANKVIEKNAAYLEKAGQLVGYKQSLEKRIESATNKEDLKGIVYKSVFLEE